ncbi:endonuclease MutS2 [Helicobacter enhydrae]|uniref:Endonuclease MutS2 n=2 Tax=Helicobacter enhydrae TaxID=222136 RepID=A0A1B1U6U8_9HELI|nr:endonuclease MutS2 [Helicobacter enhydrae]
MPDSLIKKLDLEEFVEKFQTYFARHKGIEIGGNTDLHKRLLQELESFLLPSLPKVQNLDKALLHIQKMGVLHLEEIIDFCKIILFFQTLKKASYIPKDGRLEQWLQQITLPEKLQAIAHYFNDDGEIKEGIFQEIDSLREHLSRLKKDIAQALSSLLRSDKLSPYLVDHQIHYVNATECLLLKAGFHQVIKGMVLARSQGGFFYLAPQNLVQLKEKEGRLQDLFNDCIYRLCKEISGSFLKHILFLKFINQAFDFIDHINARSRFAKDFNLEFLFPTQTKDIILRNYAHPNLKNPTPLHLEWRKSLLIITGVNAGGKTMLLKSVLSVALLSKYLIPQSLNAHQSKIGHFKEIHAIISDPQNSKNDISTFAGRMLQVSHILSKQTPLVAIDEIELGTDADEASSLYKEILETLIERGAKVIITTHHKRLASLMVSHPQTQLYAAIFDEKNQIPTFGFLKGSIGKSYAFETASRYGIPDAILQKAKKHYGKDKERLNELIERSTSLEMELMAQKNTLQQEIHKAKQKQQKLDEALTHNAQQNEALQNHLHSLYNQALNTLKKEAKNLSQIHQNMNEANKILKQAQQKPPNNTSQELRVGDYVKYGNNKGIIVEKRGDLCVVECEGLRLKTKTHQITPTHKPPLPKTPKKHITYTQKPVGITLDLHGLRVEEALEKAEVFISDCLLAGYDEVLIYHGIGGGILAKAIKDFLKHHPKVVRFEDAPPQMGGFGAKLIWL